ncbi:MAG: hypothetical protein WD512_16865, partial [Candidatus Paceibacterota bacterium]
MIKIFLANQVNNNATPTLWIEFTNSCKDIENLSMRFTKKDSVTQRAITNELTFYDGAYSFIYDRLIVIKDDYVWVKVEIEGFNYTFPLLQIQWKAIEFCSNTCEIKATLNTWSLDLDAYKRIRNTLIWDEDFLNNINYLNQWTGQNEPAHPMMRVKWEKGGINGNEWNWSLVGIYIRHYFYNLCKKTGLEPSSSIFSYIGLNAWTGNDYDDDNYFNNNNYIYNRNIPQPKRNPYHYSAVFLNKGVTDTTESFNVNNNTTGNRILPNALSNALNWNGIQFLENFAIVFNAFFRVKNGKLEFERKDYFFQTSNEWVNLSDKNICLKLKTQDNWAYLRLQYGPESSLWQTALAEVGSLGFTPQQAISTFPPYPIFAEKYYNEIVEWNNPVSERQENELTRSLPFAELRSKIIGVSQANNTDKYGVYVWSL